MHNEKERRIFQAAREVLSVEEKQMIADRAGLSLPYVQQIISRQKVDRHNIAEMCLEQMQGEFSDVGKNIRQMRKVQKRLNAIDWRSVMNGVKYLQGL